MIDVPVLLIVYRRADLAAVTLQAIAAARPKRLFVAADGPAGNSERAACEAARVAATSVTWPCEVQTDFSAHNLGCGARVTSALDWLFTHADRGIVLEDDCVPAQDFFPFCGELLDRYRDDTRIMHISGETYATRPIDDSYYFSKYPLTWGWATWKRAWALCDRELSTWATLRARPELESLFDTADERNYLTDVFQQRAGGSLTDWDYAWWYSCMTQGLAIHPGVNLVSNAGSDPRATHTTGGDLCHRPVTSLAWPLRHPGWTLRNVDADVETFDRRLVGATLRRQRTIRHHAGRPGRWLRRTFTRTPRR